MARNALIGQELRSVTEQHLAQVTERSRQAVEPFRLDPLAFIERLRVWNPWRMRFEPFRVWPHQEELVRGWVSVEKAADAEGVVDWQIVFHNLLVEKSRQMGDTVISAATCLWVVTHWDAPLLMQHQKLTEVSDSGPTWDSFFGKIKLMWQEQPTEIGRAELVFVGGGNPLIRNAGHAQRFITGEGMTPEPGRGGRYAGAVIDEAARIRYDQQAQAALGNACPSGRLMLSTPKGRGNVYYRIRQNPPADWAVQTHHWAQHPDYGRGAHVAGSQLDCRLCIGNMAGVRYDPMDVRAHRYPGKLTSAWYERSVTEYTDEQVAEEFDIDYTASLTARVYTEFKEVAHVLPRIDYDPALPIMLSWDYGLDVTAVGVWQESPTEMRKIGELETGNAVPEEVCDDLRAVLRQLGLPETELAKDQTVAWLCIGDPWGAGKNLATNRPLTADYLTAGFSIVSRPMGILETIRAYKRMLLGRPKRVVYSRATCPLTVLHLQSNRWPTDAQGNRRPGANEPKDDVHNHMCRADAYLMCWKFPPPMDVQTLPPGRHGPDLLRYEGLVAEQITRDMVL